MAAIFPLGSSPQGIANILKGKSPGIGKPVGPVMTPATNQNGFSGAGNANDKANAALSNMVTNAPTTTPPAGGGASGIDGIYDARMASEMQKLQAARDAALQGYNQQETLAKQTGYDNRNAADVVNMQNVRALKEQMAANGLSSSGDNITASGNLASARLGAINDINRTQANTLQDIAQKRALTISQEAASELALTQQINADRAAAKLDQSRYDDQKAFNEANITGYLNTPEMQQQYGIVNQAKQDYANAKTPQERLAAHKRAEDARALITQMGGNAGLVGADVTAQQAGANKGQYGIETSAHQQQIWDQNHTDARDKVADTQWDKSFNLQNKQVMANLTGYMPDGTPTDAKQQQDIQNLWTVAAQTGKIPDKLADMYGIPRGTQTQAAYQFARGVWESNRAFNHQASQDAFNNGLAQDSNDLAWINAANKQDGGSGAAKYDGFSPNQVLDAVKGQLYDKDGYPKDGSKAVSKQAIYDSVMGYGLPMGQDDQVLLALGLTKDDIAAFDQKAFGGGK